MREPYAHVASDEETRRSHCSEQQPARHEQLSLCSSSAMSDLIAPVTAGPPSQPPRRRPRPSTASYPHHLDRQLANHAALASNPRAHGLAADSAAPSSQIAEN